VLFNSKTINLPEDLSFEDFVKLYGKIHDSGIKGCTTYRAGTSVAVLETQKKEKEKSIKKQQKEFLEVFKEQENGDIISHDVKLPDEYPAKGFILKSEGKKWYVHVAFKDKACTKPFAIFVNTNNREDNVLTYNALEKLEEIAEHKGLNHAFIEETKKKYAYQKNPVKICRMLGLLLRHNIDVYTIVKGLDELEASPGTFVFRVKKFLGQFITKIHDAPQLCPECGEMAIVFESGCFECKNCAHTKC
jgi:ribonucleoside-diphosphate reductase alpha chain